MWVPACGVYLSAILALLARWYYSSWRDGEWLPFDGFPALPYRKLVNAIHRINRDGAGLISPTPG